MSFGVCYLSTGIKDTAFDSQVLPILGAAVTSGMDLLHISFDPFGYRLKEGYIEKQRELDSMGVKTLYLRQAPPISKGSLMIDVKRLSGSFNRLHRSRERIVLHCRGHLNTYRGLLLKGGAPESVRVIADLRGAVVDEINHGSKGVAGNLFGRYLTKFYRGIEYQVLRKADQVLCVSKAFREYLHSIYPVPNIAVIPTFVDTSRFHFSKERRELYRENLGVLDRIVLVFSGGMAPWQKPEAVIRFFVSLKQRVGNLFMLFLSQEPSFFQRTIGDQIHPDDFKAIRVPHREVAEYLCAADVGLLLRDDRLTNRVAAPIKFSEYMCCGLPCLVSEKVGDTAEVVQKGEAGIILDSKRPIPTPSEIQGLLSVNREKISEAMAKRYSSHIYLPELLSLYRALGEGGGGPWVAIDQTHDWF